MPMIITKKVKEHLDDLHPFCHCALVELKAKTALEDVHLAQAMNYLEAYQKEIGLLINFGARSLQFKRVHNNKIIKKIL